MANEIYVRMASRKPCRGNCRGSVRLVGGGGMGGNRSDRVDRSNHIALYHADKKMIPKNMAGFPAILYFHAIISIDFLS